MVNLASTFADSGASSSGLGAFNVNLKEFLFQFATFVIVLLVLRRWVFPKLVATLEERRKTLEDSLVAAKKTEEALVSAEAKAEDIIAKARAQADGALRDAKTEAKDLIAQAETNAEQRAGRVLDEAGEQLAREREKLRSELKEELADLVVATTTKVLGEKLKGSADTKLIQKSIKELR